MQFGTRARRFALVAAILLAPMRVGRATADDRGDFIARTRTELEKVDRAIARLEKQVGRTRGQARQAELLHRLAEHMAERARLEYRLAAETAASGPPFEDPKVVSAREVAIQHCRRILRDHPAYPKRDEVLWLMGAQSRELGRYDDMLSTFQRLHDLHPKSPATGRAQMVTGDFYFDRSELDRAGEYYQRVIDLPASPLANLARYKLAWVAINQDDCARATALLEKVIGDPAARTPIESPGSRLPIDLRLESLDTLIFCYDKVYRTDRVIEYFGSFSLTEKEQLHVYPRLARRLELLMSYRPALILYCRLARLATDPKERAEWQRRAREVRALAH